MKTESEVVRDIFKWMKKKCKEQKQSVERAEEYVKKTKRSCYFEDEMCLVDSAERELAREQGKLDGLVEAKIGIEKYMRKLRHEEEEKKEMSYDTPPLTQHLHEQVLKCHYKPIEAEV